jgi:hypothetical protein
LRQATKIIGKIAQLFALRVLATLDFTLFAAILPSLLQIFL